MKTRVSVIIPVYNVQEFLKECVDSVLAQTLINKELTDGYERNLQIILIDDGSTDDSGKIAKEYADSFDNIDYIYEENQGLGHARNYGCEFAEGDYIIFLDSDDIVPPKAYERMYDSAVKNDVDFTIGNVTRFNSKKTRRNKIHLIAFSTTKEVTHITETPELFYDTTAWNKLIKKTFWKKHDFKFPEGILYEDIPVSMPMHYLADKVSIIYETCYLWRIREGMSKSITQTTDDTKNLKDRLAVLRMVDDFYNKNVNEKDLHLTKTIKWLKIDLKMYVETLIKQTEEESIPYRDLLIDYIKENIDLNELNYLNEIDKLKYEYLLNDEFDKLVNLINFEKKDLKFTKVYPNGSHMVIDVDENIFGTSPFIVDQFLKEDFKIKNIQNIALKKNELIVKAFTIIPGIEIKDFKDREYSFNLVNSDSHKKLPLEFDNVKSKNLPSEFNIQYGNNLSYDAASFQVHVPYSKLIDDPEFNGENRIEVNFKQDDVVYNYFLSKPKKRSFTASNLKARIYENTYIYIAYDEYKELILNINPIKYCYDEVMIKEDKLCINSPEHNGDLYLCYDENLLNDEYNVPLDYNSEKQFYFIDLDKIANVPGQIRYENGEPIVYKDKKQLYLHSNEGQIIINALRDYHFDIQREDNLSLISKISSNNQTVDMDVDLYSINNLDNLNSAVLYLKDNVNFEDAPIASANINNGKINFNFNFSNENILKNLYNGVHDVYVKYDVDGIVFTTPLYLLNQFSHEYSAELHDYKLYRSGKSTLRIRSTSKWPESENTKMKRKELSRTKYELFRKLPVNPKRIMFESMWGRQFSCNPRYLYEYINENYPDYECIWSFIDEQKRITGNAKRVRKNSLKYYYYLATSKFFCDNVNFDNEFIKRDEQVYIQTMHGTPLKTLGLDVKHDFKSKENEKQYIDRCKRWDYLLVQSDYVAGLSKRCFDYDEEILKFGYPRNDILYSNDNPDEINKLKEKLGIPLDKKVILYAPTWRMKNDFDLMLDLKSFKKSLSDEYVLILRMHHLASNKLNQLEKDDFIFDLSKYGSIEELYLVSDILITDYSSAMFDYAILDRPILLFAYDMEEYVNSIRGTYFDLEEYHPGPILYTSKEVENAIINLEDIEEEYKEDRYKFKEKFLQYECEKSSELIFNKVFNNNKSNSIKDSFNKIVSKIGFEVIK
ncbi:bifunctional glycosyltransferase/CDP-glycerol:glycerophosphate glycerophosphotransferase [Methanobrevibacter thaueri]|uniref:CDP-glycerol:poly(Glycerophosphate) glycerophosphotransferase n=1 Tax=Methanobrevibacter thaueri TaxID=190975 RepID=A0A315XPK7_9EURY|nr:bifunctional glycosyltransferase/CDP-glycerol:glycerophosphate glycerophosphotransferase [Methanobrevibacter thaueri]PWB88326.1 CDP-glycerol:poly(glycerophosphate) glycerophosphotransferase [Methanobrevibacter thaueri]